MAREIELVPSKIRFMHNRINSKFSNEISLSETIDKIERGEMDVYDLPKIRVVRKDGYYYAFDNRRLYVYRVLHYHGKLDKIKVKLTSLRRFQPERFTTENNGQSVRLQRGRTLTHSEATSPPSSPETFSDVEEDEDDFYDLFSGLNLESSNDYDCDENAFDYDFDCYNDEPNYNFGFDDDEDYYRHLDGL